MTINTFELFLCRSLGWCTCTLRTVPLLTFGPVLWAWQPNARTTAGSLHKSISWAQPSQTVGGCIWEQRVFNVFTTGDGLCSPQWRFTWLTSTTNMLGKCYTDFILTALIFSNEITAMLWLFPRGEGGAHVENQMNEFWTKPVSDVFFLIKDLSPPFWFSKKHFQKLDLSRNTEPHRVQTNVAVTRS